MQFPLSVRIFACLVSLSSLKTELDLTNGFLISDYFGTVAEHVVVSNKWKWGDGH